MAENRIFAQLFENEDSNSTGYNYRPIITI